MFIVFPSHEPLCGSVVKNKGHGSKGPDVNVGDGCLPAGDFFTQYCFADGVAVPVVFFFG